MHLIFCTCKEQLNNYVFITGENIPVSLSKRNSEEAIEAARRRYLERKRARTGNV